MCSCMVWVMGKVREMSFQDWSTDALEQRSMELEEMVGRIRMEQARILTELAERGVASVDGCRTMTDWVASRLDVSMETARDLMVLARTENVFPEGVSFDRAVAATRLADAGATEERIEASYGWNIAGVRRSSAFLRRHSRRDSQRAVDSRYLSIRSSLDEEIWHVSARLPGLDGRIVEKALTQRADEFPRSEDYPQRRDQRLADALTAICMDWLGGEDQTRSEESAPDAGLLATILIEAKYAALTKGEAGVVIEAGPRAGVEALLEILCGGSVGLIAWTGDGMPMKYGRTTRVIPPALRRAVFHRDGHACTIDGCSSRYRLQAHHINPYWEDATQGIYGVTDPDNLTTVCWYHHHVIIHGQNRQLDPNSPPQRRRFLPRLFSGTDPPSS